MDSVRNATFRIGFPPPYVSLRSIRCKSLDRHMAASSILKWQNSLQRASRLVDTMRLLFILKWQGLIKLDKSIKINIIVV